MKKRTLRVLGLILVAAMLLSLAGCGNKETNETENGEETDMQSTYPSVDAPETLENAKETFNNSYSVVKEFLSGSEYISKYFVSSIVNDYYTLDTEVDYETYREIEGVESNVFHVVSYVYSVDETLCFPETTEGESSSDISEGDGIDFDLLSGVASVNLYLADEEVYSAYIEYLYSDDVEGMQDDAESFLSGIVTEFVGYDVSDSIKQMWNGQDVNISDGDSVLTIQKTAEKYGSNLHTVGVNITVSPASTGSVDNYLNSEFSSWAMLNGTIEEIRAAVESEIGSGNAVIVNSSLANTDGTGDDSYQEDSSSITVSVPNKSDDDVAARFEAYVVNAEFPGMEAMTTETYAWGDGRFDTFDEALEKAKETLEVLLGIELAEDGYTEEGYYSYDTETGLIVNITVSTDNSVGTVFTEDIIESGTESGIENGESEIESGESDSGEVEESTVEESTVEESGQSAETGGQGYYYNVNVSVSK